MEAEAGLLIAYATGPGEVALDGDGEHSPFTTALLEHLETPNLSVVDLMIDVRNHVLELTNNRQKPWDRSSLTKRFCFVTGAPAIAPAASVAEEWAAIQNGTSPGILANFAARYPFEPWNRYAEMRIAELRESDRKLTTASKVIDAYDTPIPRLEQLVNSRKGELGGGGMIGHAELARLIQIATRSTARLLRRSGQPLASSFVVRGSDLAAELGDRLYVMTAGHAVSAGQHGFAAGPGDVMVLFPGLGDGPIPVKRVVWESPPREYDTALLELEIELSGEFRPLRLAKDLPALDPARNTMRGLPRVVSISYPFGGEVQFGLTASLLDYQRPTRDASGSPVREPVWIHYTAQTEPGSSGCPILDERLEVIAVHSRGMHNLPRLNGGDGTYAANAGVWIHSIAAAIKSSPDSNGGHGGGPQIG